MTEAMPFLQKTILLSYDPRPFAPGALSRYNSAAKTERPAARPPRKTQQG